MSFKWIGRLGLLMMLGLLTNCAAVTTGTDQDVEITSDPEGAKCTVTQSDTNVGHVKATPEMIHVDKSWSDLVVTCDKEGFDTSVENVASKTQGATLGNILIGGGIGLIIDAGSGAMRYYPDSHKSFLIPASFTSEDEANAFFDDLKVKVEARNEVDFKDVKKRCIDNKQDNNDCDRLLREMQSVLKEKLEALEAKRQEKLAAIGA